MADFTDSAIAIVGTDVEQDRDSARAIALERELFVVTPGSSPVPRWMARLMLSAGMFSALAAATAVRRRGFMSGSPPLLAAMLISLIRRVKILPRLASRAPFLCLIVAHFEWPDMEIPRLQ